MKITAGLAPHHRTAAAQIYWHAFHDTLGRIFSPERLALDYLARILRSDHCLSAVNDMGQLVGLAGFQSDRGRLTPFEADVFLAVYGAWGAKWRQTAARFLPQEIDNRRFLIDGICVAPAWQGQGIGHHLIDALEDQARARGYGEMRLEVLPKNTGARRLYEKRGFRVLHSEKRSFAAWVLGMPPALVMVRRL